MKYLDEIMQVRIRGNDLKRVKKVVDRHGGERYDNPSHFGRCALLKLLREEESNK